MVAPGNDSFFGSYAVNLNYGWFKRQKRRLRKPTLYLQNTPPFFNIRDNRGTHTIRNTKSIPPGQFKPSPIIHEAKEYPEHFTNPIENTKFPKFPKLPEYPVSRPQHGFSKMPSKFNEVRQHEFPSFESGNHHQRFPKHTGNYPRLPPLNNGESGHISDYLNGGPNVPHYHSHVPSFMKGGGSPFKTNHPKLANPGQLPDNIREFLPDIPGLDTEDHLQPTAGYHSKGGKSIHFHHEGRGPNVPDHHLVVPQFMRDGIPFKNNHRLPAKLASGSSLPNNIREFLPDVPTLNTDDHLVPNSQYHSKGGKLFGHHHHEEPDVPHYHSVVPSFSKNTAPFREKQPGNSLAPLKEIPRGFGHFKMPKFPGNDHFGGFDHVKVHHKRQILPNEGHDTTNFPKIPEFEHQEEFGFKNAFSHIESFANNFKHDIPTHGDHKPPPPHQPEHHEPEYHPPKPPVHHPPPPPKHHEPPYQPPKKPNFKPPAHEPYRPPKKPNFKPPKMPHNIKNQSPYLNSGTSRGKV